MEKSTGKENKICHEREVVRRSVLFKAEDEANKARIEAKNSLENYTIHCAALAASSRSVRCRGWTTHLKLDGRLRAEARSCDEGLDLRGWYA